MLERVRVGAAFGDGGATTMADECIEKNRIVSEKDSELKKTGKRLHTINSELNHGLKLNIDSYSSDSDQYNS